MPIPPNVLSQLPILVAFIRWPSTYPPSPGPLVANGAHTPPLIDAVARLPRPHATPADGFLHTLFTFRLAAPSFSSVQRVTLILGGFALHLFALKAEGRPPLDLLLTLPSSSSFSFSSLLAETCPGASHYLMGPLQPGIPRRLVHCFQLTKKVADYYALKQPLIVQFAFTLGSIRPLAPPLTAQNHIDYLLGVVDQSPLEEVVGLGCHLNVLPRGHRHFGSKDLNEQLPTPAAPTTHIASAFITLGTKTAIFSQCSCPYICLVLLIRWSKHPAVINELHI